MEHDLYSISNDFWHNNFDPYNVFLAIATNIGYPCGPGSHTYIYIYVCVCVYYILNIK